jgi:hypothetical protein
MEGLKEVEALKEAVAHGQVCIDLSLLPSGDRDDFTVASESAIRKPSNFNNVPPLQRYEDRVEGHLHLNDPELG